MQRVTQRNLCMTQHKKMETTVAKEGVHTHCSSSSTEQNSANNGKFSTFRAALHRYALCVDEG